jgi:peptide/nickel transport system permease protein
VTEHRHPLALFWADFHRNRLAMVGMVIVGFLLLAALSSFYFAPWSAVVSQDRGASLTGPSWQHWLGCDELGRDMLLRLVYGARISLLVGISVVAIGMSCGSLFGLISGYAGGWVDSVIMRLTDIFLAFPFFLLAIAVAGFLGPSLRNAILALGIATIPDYTRLVRGSVLSLREATFVEASIVAGARPPRIMIHHIFPNLVGTLFVYGTLKISTAIMAEAGLSYLGVGAQDPMPTWGKMLSNLREQILFHPWHILAPGTAILLTVMGFNFLGDGLRDLLDPRLRQVLRASARAE